MKNHLFLLLVPVAFTVIFGKCFKIMSLACTPIIQSTPLWSFSSLAVRLLFSRGQIMSATLPLSEGAHQLLLQSMMLSSIISLKVLKGIPILKNSSEISKVQEDSHNRYDVVDFDSPRIASCKNHKISMIRVRIVKYSVEGCVFALSFFFFFFCKCSNN